MLVGASRFRSLSLGVAFAFVVPAAVITCGGRVEGENDGSTPSVPAEVARGGTGPTATAQYGGQIATATGTVAPTATSTSTTAPTSTGRVFLGQYVEPDWTALGVPTPQPTVTATMSRPCEERIDTCGGTVAMRTWAAEIMRACAADTNSCGNVAVYFEPQTNCIQHATTLNPYVPYDYYLCIATVAYHTRCDASSSLGIGSVSVDTCSL